MSSGPADGGFSSVPARRRRLEAPAPPAPEYDDHDLARGQAAAVLGVLGRLQLRIDVLAREQEAAFDRIEARLSAIEAGLSAPPAARPSGDAAPPGGSSDGGPGD